MEDIKNNIEPTDAISDSFASEEKLIEKKPRKSLYIIISILGVLAIGLATYFIYTTYFKKDDTTNTEDTTSETVDDTENTTEDNNGVCSIDEEECIEDEESKSSENTEFTGDYFTATLPTGWVLREYENGNGSEYLLDGETYTGLTGLEIRNPDGDRVFSMMSVTGIGFSGCPMYAVFEDNNEDFQNEIESNLIEGEEIQDLKDYTDTEYEEFELLGTTVRRIGTEYYYDTVEGNNYFESPCVNGLITLEGLYYMDSDGYHLDAYYYGAETDATEEDLLIVDGILDSLELVD
jgi:hypothetical protein